ncbi:MAG: IclR family transcriptional regulator [Phycisphaerae bacterium]|jgi:DNA-binding IclR family transcriptional regulator
MDSYIIPNLAKALEIIKLLSSAEDGLSALEIEKQVGIARTSAFRILRTLAGAGMVEKRGTRFYGGAVLMEIGLNAVNKFKLRDIAVPVLQQLTEQTRQTSHLAVPSGHMALILEVCDSTEPVLVASRPGTLADLHCSSNGKIFLACNMLDRLDELYAERPLRRHTANTISDLRMLKNELLDVLERGYAIDDQEYHVGVRCIAAPITNIHGACIAGIGVTGPVSSLTKEKVPEVTAMVRSAAERLSGTVIG